jgi:hypothetical protein
MDTTNAPIDSSSAISHSTVVSTDDTSVDKLFSTMKFPHTTGSSKIELSTVDPHQGKISTEFTFSPVSKIIIQHIHFKISYISFLVILINLSN